MKYNKRLYDKIPELSQLFNEIRESDRQKRNEILVEIKDIIIESDPELIDKHVMEYPLDFKRRWYDKDPFTWLIINGLKYADDELTEKLVKYYRGKFKDKPES